MQIKYLEPSPHLDSLPELMNPVGGDRLNPDMFQTWDQVFAAYPDRTDYVLGPGDYRSWGRCKITLSGTHDRRRVIRFEATDRRPWTRSGYEAIIAGIEFSSGATNWIVNGLTFRGRAQNIMRPGSSDVVFDSILVEDFETYGVRLLGNRGCVQNSVMRRMRAGSDGVAVQLRVRGEPNIGNRVLDCEFADCNDSVGITQDTKEGANAFTECRDVIIDGNDMYVTPLRYVYLPDGEYASTENAADFKTGPDDPTRPNLFLHNRIWGYRRTEGVNRPPSSNGAAIVIHRAARNMHFESNFIFDCPIAFHETRRDPADPGHGPRGIVLKDNVVSAMNRYNPHDLAAVLRTRLAFKLHGNRFSRSGQLSALPKVGAGDEFIDNIVFDTPLVEAVNDFNTPPNIVATPAMMEDLLLQRRRWTGPDFALLPESV